MIERGKTVLLALLVMASLLQSYLLSFHSAEFESIREGEYIATEIVGTQEKAEQLVFPSWIALHREGDRHTVLYPGHYFYRIIMEELQDRQFDGLRISERSAGQLKRMINNGNGVEIRFNDEIPLALLRHALPIELGFMTEPDWISTVWIADTGGEPDVYLIGKDYSEAYQVLRTNLDGPTVEQLIGLGDYRPAYLAHSTGFLYPAEPVKMFRYVYPLDQLFIGNMENMLFPDPGITRNWETGDGMEIYSDGKRGMEVDSRTQWMRYTDPIASLGQPFEGAADFADAVQYVNRHGGWNGTFSLERIRLMEERSAPHFVFRQRVPSHPAHFPIVDRPEDRFGTIGVMLEGDMVTEYERSLLMIETSPATRTEAVLPGGDSLLDKISASGLMLRMKGLTPAYRPRISAETIELIPVWAVIMNDGTLVELP